ncbi:MAG: type II toxin-antitoxin system RelE/ParE family toxin [Planctomycetaceae bacterium]|jgi:toxin YoeB|nr:type II toxin-antitoxin system RelE/ParE family toxin [Planctomycetaceae bacterium]
MAKRRLTWSIQVKQEINEIVFFFRKRNGNNMYGKKLQTACLQASKMIARFNEIGTQIRLEKRHVRYVIVEGTYQLFYEITENQITIIKIWDVRRNPVDLKL